MGAASAASRRRGGGLPPPIREREGLTHPPPPSSSLLRPGSRDRRNNASRPVLREQPVRRRRRRRGVRLRWGGAEEDETREDTGISDGVCLRRLALGFFFFFFLFSFSSFRFSPPSRVLFSGGDGPFLRVDFIRVQARSVSCTRTCSKSQVGPWTYVEPGKVCMPC